MMARTVASAEEIATRTRQALVLGERAFDQVADEEQLTSFLIVLALSDVGAVIRWIAIFSQHWIASLVYGSLFVHPAQLMYQLMHLSVVGTAATIVDAIAFTDFGTQFLVFFVTMRSLLSWALNPPEPRAYVPKRKRGWKPLFHGFERITSAVAGVLKDTLIRGKRTVELLISLNEMAVENSAGTPEEASKGDNRFRWSDNDEEFTMKEIRASSSTYPEMLWDLDTPRDQSMPTKFELFMRFLNALKAGAAIASREGNPMVAYSLVMWSLSGATNGSSDDHQYDTDSVLIAIDNCSSRCMTNCMRDFIDSPQKVNVSVQGVGGSVRATYKGTVKWTIEDEDGRTHHFVIPDTYFNPTTPYRLLSPQHWAKVSDDNYPAKRGTWCATYEDAVELFWAQGKFKRVITLSPSSNIALVRSAPAFSKLHAFCAQVRDEVGREPIDEFELMAMPTVATVSDEESGSGSSDESDDEELPTGRLHPDLPPEAVQEQNKSEKFQQEMTHAFRMKKDLRLVEQEPLADGKYLKYQTDQADILAWHYRLGHISFERIRKLAERGDLPAKLARARAPKCASCMFGKATRRPWRTRTPNNQKDPLSAGAPGSVVGVDQLISSTPGLIGQMRGLLTRKRYTVSTVFVDHHSGLSFVHFQTSTSAEQTIAAKRAFERYAKTFGVQVRHYHADNGIFDSKAFAEEVHNCGQSITYAAVNAHHMNGKAEKKIRDLQEAARTMLLHAKQRWPTAIDSHLWPFAVRQPSTNVEVADEGRL
ncbi:Retrotransposon protein [Seminavis robusta]|uniref:Retrotransposon protein n=1 Tax=Seminavis robusta TaxID=568900 RepID=A0A9N8E1X9_9STRA|nr:Retrotransposon protein [Seminavis robusta]|eukprot:Sro569_g168360.1 Retrotransposon protein (762) ;mRNA; f:26209-28823